MASENLNVDITAKDDASKVIDPIQKKVDKLEKTDAEVALGADDNASKPIDAVQKKLDKIDGEEVTADVKAETSAAESDVDSFASRLQRLTAEDQVVLLSMKAAGVQQELTDLMTDVSQLDASDPTIEIKLDRISELSGELDGLKTQIKGIADTPIDQGGLGGSVDGVKNKLGEMKGEADQSRSVFANMVGNSAQDLGQLGGAAGTAGVALGQVAEYAADGSLSLAGMAAAAPAMLILGGAIKLVTGYLEKQAEVKAFNANQVKDFTAAIQDATPAAETLLQQFKKAGEIKQIPLFGDEAVNVVPKLDKINASASEYIDLVTKGGPAFEAFKTKHLAMGASVKDVEAVIDAAGAANENYMKSEDLAAQAARVFGVAVADNTGALAASHAATNTAISALDEWADRTVKGVEGMQAYKDALAGMDWGAAALDGAVTAMSAFTVQHNGLIDTAAASEEAFDNLSSSVKENGDTFDVTTEQGRANQSALEDLASTLDTKLAAAYKDSGGDVDVFKAKAQALATETLTRLQKELGLSDEQTADLAKSLGLLPEDIETRYKMSGDEEAKLKIGLLQTAINNLPDDVQTTVTQQIIAGDYQGALATVQNYWTNHAPSVPVNANTSGFDTDVAGAKRTAEKPVTIPVTYKATNTPLSGRFAQGGTVGQVGGIAGEAGAEFVQRPGHATELLTQPTYVPPGTQVTSTRKTRTILQRRTPRYANGTSQPAVVPRAAPMTFAYNQNAPVYGVEDLNRHLDAWGRQIAAKISAGRR